MIGRTLSYMSIPNALLPILHGLSPPTLVFAIRAASKPSASRAARYSTAGKD